jgi:hypothetical protein
MAKKRSKQNPLLLVGIGVAVGYVLFNKKDTTKVLTETKARTIFLPTPKEGKIIQLRGIPRGMVRRPLYI